MLHIDKLRKTNHKIIALGSHANILQSMLDFDYLAGKGEPSLVGIVAAGRKYERFFWGKKEIVIPWYNILNDVPKLFVKEITLFLNLSSGRRTLPSTLEALEFFPNLLGGSLFAENVPEKHSLEIYNALRHSRAGGNLIKSIPASAGDSSLGKDPPLDRVLSSGRRLACISRNDIVRQGQFVIGPASVGIIIPQKLKLGAIGGTQVRQLVESHLFESGNVAVLSSSGGMVNEMIRLVTQKGKRLSFSLAFGGDRFPVLTPKEAFLAAEKDTETEYIVYFGELGGYDEYELVTLLKEKKITKKVIVYIAGTISEMFETPPQFGHAKAMAGRVEESALEKRKALKKVGVQVAESFNELIEMLKKIKTNVISGKDPESMDPSVRWNDNKIQTTLKELESRKHALFVTTVSSDEQGVAKVMGEDLLSLAKNHSFAYIVASMLLGKKKISKELEEFTDLIIKLLVDHGPYVSGAVNTMIAARAGKDLVSSLVAGLLTIGPRFGGAINEAALNWYTGVIEKKEPYEFIEEFAKNRKYISGIGHRKYRLDFPDPRVSEILKLAKKLRKPQFTNFAISVQGLTTAKKANLILNVDGAIAAVLLDILVQRENISLSEIENYIHSELFNAYFVLSRSVGFMAHYLAQRRLDEGLFRLPEDEVTLLR